MILVRALQLFYDLMVLTPPSLIFSNHSIQPSVHIINKKVHDFEVKIQTWGCVFSGGMLVKAGPGHYNAKLCGFFSLKDSLWPNKRYLSKRLSQIWLMIYWPPSCTLLGSVVWSDDVRLTQITIYWNILVLNIHVWPYQCPRNLPDVNTHKEVNRQHCSI